MSAACAGPVVTAACAETKTKNVVGDVSTGREITSFTQPIHADRLVTIELAQLEEPLESYDQMRVEGVQGRVVRMALDGRVLLDFGDQNDTFFRQHRMRATQDDTGACWLDLAKFEYETLD